MRRIPEVFGRWGPACDRVTTPGGGVPESGPPPMVQAPGRQKSVGCAFAVAGWEPRLPRKFCGQSAPGRGPPCRRHHRQQPRGPVHATARATAWRRPPPPRSEESETPPALQAGNTIGLQNRPNAYFARQMHRLTQSTTLLPRALGPQSSEEPRKGWPWLVLSAGAPPTLSTEQAARMAASEKASLEAMDAMATSKVAGQGWGVDSQIRKQNIMSCRSIYKNTENSAYREMK